MIENEKPQIEQSTACKRCNTSIKLKFFSIFDICHNNVTFNKIFAFLILACSFCNIYSFIIDEESKIYDSQVNAEYIRMIPRVLSVSYYLKTSLPLIQGSMIAILALLSIEILLFVYLLCVSSRSREYTKYLFCAKFFYALSVVIYWILLMPVLDLCMKVLSYTFADIGLVYVALSIVNIVLTLAFATIHSFFGHVTYYSSTTADGFARVDCNFEQYYMISRVILIVLYFITLKFQLSYWIIISVNAFMAILFFNFNYSKLLFYTNLMCRAFMYFICLYFWIIITAIIIVLAPYKDPAWFIIIGCILLYPISNGIVTMKLVKIIKRMEYHKHVKMPFIADKFLHELTAIEHITDKMDSRSIILAGLAENHDKECQTERCLLKEKPLFYIPTKEEFMTKENFDKKDKHYNLCYILILYQFYLRQVKHLSILISYLNFQYEEVGNVIELLFQLYNADLRFASIQQEFSIYRFKLMAIDKCEKGYSYSISDVERGNVSLNLNTVIEYYTLVSLLKTLMIEAANTCFIFWNGFIFNTENTNVYENGIDIFESNHKLEYLYTKVRSIYSRDEGLNNKYSEYIRYVRGDEKLAIKYENNLDRIERIEEIREFEKVNSMKEFFFSFDSVILIVNFTNERNVVEKVTESIHTVFGYTPHQIIGKEIENLMPPFFKTRHQMYINFHFQTGIKRLIGKEVPSLGFNSKHFSLQIRMMVMMLPNLDNKQMYMGILQKTAVDYGLMVVYPNGKIESISDKLSKKLKLTNEEIIENDLYIYHIIISFLIDERTISIGKDKIFDIKKFQMQTYETTKMKYCIDPVIVGEIRKVTKMFDNQNKFLFQNNTSISLRAALTEIINLSETSYENWPRFETEIIEEIYYNGVNKQDNSLFICKVFIDDTEDSSKESEIHSANKAHAEKMNENEITKDEKVKLKGKGKGSCNNNKHVIKDLNCVELKNETKHHIKQLILEENNSPVKSPVKKNFTEGISSIVASSTFTSGVYQNYSNFRKKLQQHLTENQKSKFAQYIGFSLLVILITSSVLIFYFEYHDLLDKLEVFTTASTICTIYDNLNCIEKEFNNWLLVKSQLYANPQFSYNENILNDQLQRLSSCEDVVISSQNFNLQITENQVIQQVKLKLENETFLVLGFPNDPVHQSENTIPMMHFLMTTLDYIYKIQTTPFNPSSKILLYVKQNLHRLIENIFIKGSDLMQDTFLAHLITNSNYNVLYVSLRLSVIFFSFIVILPILIVKKSDQLKILENFFQIRNEDAEIQRDNCKKFITTQSNLKIDDGPHEENKEEKEKENKEDEGLINEDEEKKKESKSFGFFGKKEKKDTKKKETKPKKGKTHFSSKLYIINITLLIFFVILLISIVPIVNYQYELRMFQSSEMFIKNKISVDVYAYTIERIFLETQNLLLKASVGETITSEDIRSYNETFNSVSLAERNFSNFVFSAYDLVYYDQLYTFLQKDMCEVFNEYRAYSISDCVDYQNQNAQKGIKPIFSQVTSILTDISQDMIRQKEINSEYANKIIKTNNYMYLDTIMDKFVFDGFNLILDILTNSFAAEVEAQKRNLIIFFTVFLVVLLVNQLVVWNRISSKIHSMETDTYKLFSILPIAFIVEYPNLYAFLKKITQDDE